MEFDRKYTIVTKPMADGEFELSNDYDLLGVWTVEEQGPQLVFLKVDDLMTEEQKANVPMTLFDLFGSEDASGV